MKTKKAGCILINKENKSVAIVYRDKQNDFSFPKGHLEEGETLEECAIRETAEETKRIAIILDNYPPYVGTYITPRGEDCINYTYIAIDGGHSNNTSTDTHQTLWIPFDDVELTLTYPSQKKLWKQTEPLLDEIFNTPSPSL